MLRLETERLVMRPPQASDAPIIQTVLSNFEISKFLSRVDHPLPEGKAAGWIARNSSTSVAADVTFALFDKTGNFCGVSSFDLDAGTDEPELGYYLDVPYWGMGLMSEATNAALTWLFNNSDVTTVRSGAFGFNPASLAVQYKFGFKDVKTEQRPCLARNGNFPLTVTSLAREDFMPWQRKRYA